MGDALWIEPVLRKLSEDYKKVIVLSQFYELFRNYPLKNVQFRRKWNWLEKFYIKHLAPRFFKNYGIIHLDMAYENRPTKHILDAYFEAAGYPPQHLSYPRLYLTEAEKLTDKTRPYVLLHLDPPSIMLNYRNAHGIDWQMVINHLQGLGYEVFIISNNKLGDKYNVQTVTPTIRGLISLIYNAAFFIGLDSGPSHIATCLGKPVMIFFGAVNPWLLHIKEQFAGIIMQKPCEFAGCYHDLPGGIRQPCKLVGNEGIPKCGIHTADEVIEKIKLLVAAV